MIAELHPGLLVFPVFVVMAFLVVRAARKHARKTREEIAAFAGRSGLSMTEKTVLGITTVESLDGVQQGRPVRYWTYSTGSGKSRTNWVAVGVSVPGGVALQFDLTRQNFASKVMELFGVREIQVGDAAFDQAWFVRTNQPEFFAAALVPAIRAKLMAEAGDWRGAGYKLEHGIVRYAETGTLTIATLERLGQKLPLLHDLADVAEVSARV